MNAVLIRLSFIRLSFILCLFTLLTQISLANANTLFPIGNANLRGIDQKQGEVLPAEQAFVFSEPIYDGKQIFVSWQIAPEHYLYRERFTIRLLEQSGVKLGELTLPVGKTKQDEFFGVIQAIYERADIGLGLARQGTEAMDFLLEVAWQGCNEAYGICHPPQRVGFRGTAPALKAGELANPDALTFTKVDLPSIAVADKMAAELALPPPPELPSTPPLVLSEQDQIAASLAQNNILITLLSFLGFGLLLAFTPCVFPMIPILSGIIAGQKNTTPRQAFILSLIYVLAMALTYTVIGIIAGLFGSNLQATFQNVWVLSLFSFIFVLLALSMFGFYELQLPSAIQNYFNKISQRQSGGTHIGVAIMGVLSALIVGPCVAAPLMGALIYIGQTGDAILGGMALFSLSIGMGLPLLLIGTSAGKLLPRAGKWMESIKIFFGIMLLAVAIWLLERILPATASMLLWASLFILTAAFMGAFTALPTLATGWQKLTKGMAIMLFLHGSLIMVGSALGNHDMLNPLRSINLSANTTQSSPLIFQKADTLAQVESYIAQAKGKQVLLDIYADWCSVCKEMEKYTFSDPAVKMALQDILLLKADVTNNTAEHQALLKHFSLIGPPAILFFNQAGEEQTKARLVGFIPAKDFLKQLNTLKN